MYSILITYFFAKNEKKVKLTNKINDYIVLIVMDNL